jgi:hypothetical protein
MTQPNLDQILDKITDSESTMGAIALSLYIGAVIGIAGGFYALYKLLSYNAPLH